MQDHSLPKSTLFQAYKYDTIFNPIRISVLWAVVFTWIITINKNSTTTQDNEAGARIVLTESGQRLKKKMQNKKPLNRSSQKGEKY